MSIKRVKALIVNSNNEIMVCLNNKQYQFPGGHVEGNEPLKRALKRELIEETGIEFDIKNDYFHKIHYDLTDDTLDIYYFIIYSDKKPVLCNTNYTDEEKMGNFTIEYIPLSKVEDVLINNIEKHPKNRFIVPEMLEALSEYRRKKTIY